METNSFSDEIVDDNNLNNTVEMIIIDVHHRNLCQQDNPSELLQSKWCDFVQISSDEDDPSLPPIGRSRLSFSKLSSKPPRRQITRKIITENPSNSISEAQVTVTSPSIIESTNIDTEYFRNQIDGELTIDSLIEFYSNFYDLVPNHGLSQMERQFLQFYFEFLMEKNNEKLFSSIPMLGNIPLDLYHFYIRVVEKGGYLKMSPSDWEDVYNNMRNYDTLLKKPETIIKPLYIQYLMQFEDFVRTQSTLSEFNDDFLKDIQKQNLEEFRNRNSELRKLIMKTKVRKNCEIDDEKLDMTPKTSTVNNQSDVQEISDSSSDSDTPMHEVPKQKLTKNSMLQMQQSKTRAYLSFSKKGKTINLKVDLYSTPTALEIMKRETIIGIAQVYGQLIYYTFDSTQIARNENIRKEYRKMGVRVVEPGSLCYWMDGNSIIFGYGKTPKSRKQECRLTENCLVFGKLNDPNYTFEVSDTNSSLYLPSVLYEIEKDLGNGTEEWSVKLSTHAPISSEEPIPLKKRARAFTSESPKKKADYGSDSEPGSVSLVKINTNAQKDISNEEIPKEVAGEIISEEIPKDTSSINFNDTKKQLILRYRFIGEDEKDCKLVTTQFVARDYIDYSTIMSLLRRDNVKTSNLLEIRYYNEGPSVELSGWKILPDNFKRKLVSSQTVIQVLLRDK